MKPGDKVYCATYERLSYEKSRWIAVGILEKDEDGDARVLFGWIMSESVGKDDIFTTEEEAKAHVRVLLKRRVKKMRRDLAYATTADVETLKAHDRTKYIPARLLKKLKT